MKIETKIIQFLEKKKTAWSETTLKSCAAFLRNHGAEVALGNPHGFLLKLQAEKKNLYSIQTYFIHAGNFYEYLYPTKDNVFKAYRKDNRNVFKNAYQSKTLEIEYDEIKALIESQPESEEKTACLYILKSAQRSSEANLARTLSERKGDAVADATILGKGGKRRVNLGYEYDAPRDTTYYRVYRYLKKLAGISPHDLRKLALTRAACRGAGAADLCEIAGWSDIRTAIRYLQPKRTEILRGFLD